MDHGGWWLDTGCLMLDRRWENIIISLPISGLVTGNLWQAEFDAFAGVDKIETEKTK
jgi:hypothetical protein